MGEIVSESLLASGDTLTSSNLTFDPVLPKIYPQYKTWLPLPSVLEILCPSLCIPGPHAYSLDLPAEFTTSSISADPPPAPVWPSEVLVFA